ncbi:hypothetical protein CFAM422_000768, partial [Trichoderma lentiforme]
FEQKAWCSQPTGASTKNVFFSNGLPGRILVVVVPCTEHPALPCLLSRTDPVATLTPWLQRCLDLQAMINASATSAPLEQRSRCPAQHFQPASSKTWETGEAAICASPCVAGVATNESTPGCGSSNGHELY